MKRFELNVTTGVQTEIELTPQEEADVVALIAAGEAARNTPEALRVVADEAEREVAKVDSAVLALVNQTRVEWTAWAQTNFPTLTVAERNRIGTICWLLAVAIRRLMR